MRCDTPLACQWHPERCTTPGCPTATEAAPVPSTSFASAEMLHAALLERRRLGVDMGPRVARLIEEPS